MGYSASATVMVGCVVTYDMLHTQKYTRVCTKDRRMPENAGAYPPDDLTDCELESSGVDYSAFKACPYCLGAIHKNLVTQVVQPLIAGESLSEGAIIPVPDDFPYKVELANNRYEESVDSPKVTWVIGIKLHEVDSNSPSGSYSSLNMVDFRAKLKSVLEPIGLWREVNFGVHTLFYESY